MRAMAGRAGDAVPTGFNRAWRNGLECDGRSVARHDSRMPAAHHRGGQKKKQQYSPYEQGTSDIPEDESGERHPVATLACQPNLTSCHVPADDRRDEGDADSELGDTANERGDGQAIRRALDRVRIVPLHIRLRRVSHCHSTS